MIEQGWIQLAIIVVAILIFAPILGKYIAGVFGEEKTRSSKIFEPVEKLIYKVSGIDSKKEQRWHVYASSVIAFSLVSILVLFLLQRFQQYLPLNPTDAKNVGPALSFNTAVSFVTNTNWQNYGGELTMSHLTQMIGLAVQNFLSAGVGIAVAIALVRGLTRENRDTIGNFWVDITKSVTRILLPLAVIFAIVFASQGIIQNFRGFREVKTVAGATQQIPGGPVASQEAIKEIGTNGGGFYNANASHPFENPNNLTSLLQVFLLLIIPFALAASIGYFTKQKRQGIAIFSVMMILFISSSVLIMHFDSQSNVR